jgi:hypothetical protein
MGEVVTFPGITKLNVPPERILKKAIEADLESVIVSGFTKDGQLYCCSSVADGGNTLWLCEMFKQQLMAVVDAMVDGEGG